MANGKINHKELYKKSGLVIPFMLLGLVGLFSTGCSQNEHQSQSEEVQKTRQKENSRQPRHYQVIQYTPFYKFNQAIEHQASTDKASVTNTPLIMMHVNKGDYKNALRRLYQGQPSVKVLQKQVAAIKARYRTTPAVDYIVKEAQKHQFVIINEIHESSLHRVFTKSLLKKLRAKGYQHLGLETLNLSPQDIAKLNERKYPMLSDGTYIPDPQFGDMVRYALKLGYRVFAYDVGQGDREKLAAENVVKEMAPYSEGKCVIHCGINHAFEGVIDWGKSLAAHLTEFTGHNPLTVSQTAYMETDQIAKNPAVLQALDLQESSVLLDEQNKPIPQQWKKGHIDLVVVHPPTTYENNRPVWLFQGENQKVTLKLNDLALAFPVMLLAYCQGEDVQKAVPMDIVEVAQKDQTVCLALRKGGYQIVVVNAQSQARKFSLRVE